MSQNDKARETLEKINEMDSPHNSCYDELSKLYKQTQISNGEKEKKICSSMFEK